MFATVARSWQAWHMHLRVHLHVVDCHQGQRIRRKMSPRRTTHPLFFSPQLDRQSQLTHLWAELCVRAEQLGVWQGLRVVTGQVHVKLPIESELQDWDSCGPDLIDHFEAGMSPQVRQELHLQLLRCKRPVGCLHPLDVAGHVKIRSPCRKTVCDSPKGLHAPPRAQLESDLLQLSDTLLCCCQICGSHSSACKVCPQCLIK
mmetsp:Transcript_107042/g.313032  ORF Transcript_107042/g.313032 Transcript_107042/m.313032 type:complete len:202 (-) Transcript_107042:202-807(-)